MLRVLALGVALAAAAGTAGAQAATASRSAVKTTTGVTKTSTQAHSRSSKKTDSQASLRAEAKISLQAARATALKEVPKGRVKSSELERENGKLIYSFDITQPGKSGIEEVNIDAIDGSVVNREHETPKAEKKEAAQEAKEKSTTKK